MNFKGVILIISSIAFALFVILNGSQAQTPKYLGGVQGKFFFYDNSSARSWTNAAAYCKSEHMELASLEKRAETELVISALQAEKMSSTYFWTSGRAITGPEGFQWNNTGNRLNKDAVINWIEQTTNDCVEFYMNLSNSSYFIRKYSCTGTNRGVLCQLQNLCAPVPGSEGGYVGEPESGGEIGGGA